MITIPTPTITLKGESVTLRPLTSLFLSLLSRHIKADTEQEKGELMIAGYVLAASEPTTRDAAYKLTSPDINEELAIIAMELSDEDASAVLKYMSDIMGLATEAEVEVATTPGKSKTIKRATRQTSTRR